MTEHRPDCYHHLLVCPAIVWADKEIERLRALNAKLTEALQKIVDEADSDDGMTAWDGGDIARDALAKVRGES